MMAKVNPTTVDDTLAEPEFVDELRGEVLAANRALAVARKELASQLRNAAQVHQSLLPAPVRHPQIDVDVRYLPIDAVGGDYCQVRFPKPSTCYVTMCDVSGHGIGPSLLATRVSSEVRHFILDGLRPINIVRSLSEFIYEHFHDTKLFLSFVSAQIDLDHRTITYSGAGHPPLLLLRCRAGLVQPLESQNTLIGVKKDCLSEEPEHTRTLAAGDRLVFFTHGLTETTDMEGRQLGQEKLAQIACDALSADIFDMADVMLDQVARFRYGPPKDDMTLIVAEIK